MPRRAKTKGEQHADRVRAAVKIKPPSRDGSKKGRPPKLLVDPDVEGKVIAGVQAMLSYEEACERAGITPETFRNWQKLAADPKRGRCYSEFFGRLQAARLDAKAAMAATIVAHGRGRLKAEPGFHPPDWRALAHVLACRHASEWVKRTALEMSGSDGKPLQVQLMIPPLEKDEDRDDDLEA